MAVEEEGLEAAARNSVGRKENRRTSETPQGTWLGVAQKGSLWLCYAGPLAEKRKSGISGSGINQIRFPGRRTVTERE